MPGSPVCRSPARAQAHRRHGVTLAWGHLFGGTGRVPWTPGGSAQWVPAAESRSTLSCVWGSRAEAPRVRRAPWKTPPAVPGSGRGAVGAAGRGWGARPEVGLCALGAIPSARPTCRGGTPARSCAHGEQYPGPGGGGPGRERGEGRDLGVFASRVSPQGPRSTTSAGEGAGGGRERRARRVPAGPRCGRALSAEEPRGRRPGAGAAPEPRPRGRHAHPCLPQAAAGTPRTGVAAALPSAEGPGAGGAGRGPGSGRCGVRGPGRRRDAVSASPPPSRPPRPKPAAERDPGARPACSPR